MVEEIAFIVTDSGRLSDTLSRAPACPEQLKKTERTFRRPSFSLLFDRNGFSTAPPLLLPDSLITCSYYLYVLVFVRRFWPRILVFVRIRILVFVR